MENNKIDDRAAATLRACDLEVQRIVLERGDMTDCTNPSSALMGRIRQAKEQASGERRSFGGHGHYSHGGGGGGTASEDVEDFIKENKLDDSAARSLREAGPDIQKQVLDRGSLVGTQNPSSACIVRIRDAKSSSRTTSSSAGTTGSTSAAAAAAVPLSSALPMGLPMAMPLPAYGAYPYGASYAAYGYYGAHLAAAGYAPAVPGAAYGVAAPAAAGYPAAAYPAVGTYPPAAYPAAGAYAPPAGTYPPPGAAAYPPPAGGAYAPAPVAYGQLPPPAAPPTMAPPSMAPPSMAPPAYNGAPGAPPAAGTSRYAPY